MDPILVLVSLSMGVVGVAQCLLIAVGARARAQLAPGDTGKAVFFSQATQGHRYLSYLDRQSAKTNYRLGTLILLSTLAGVMFSSTMLERLVMRNTLA